MQHQSKANHTVEWHSWDELHHLAKATLNNDQAWSYLQGVADKGLTHQRNLDAFAAQTRTPRVLQNVAHGHTQLELFGQHFEHPILLAPIAYQSLFHAHAEQASAAAAEAQGSVMLTSTLASQSFAQIANACQSAPWLQIYWQGDRQTTLRLIERGQQAGMTVCVLTVDAPVKQATFALPDTVRAVNLESPLTTQPCDPQQSQVFHGWMSQAPTWDDVAWLRDRLSSPLLIKGILHGADAQQAEQLGLDGVVVSNHGGRVLDGAPAALSVLPGIVNRVGGQLKILYDSGIRNGADVHTALSLGADAVLLGRPYIEGLALNGALGVAQVIRRMRDELELTMALMGHANLADVKRGCGQTHKR